MAGRGLILKWQREVIDHLVKVRPPNHASVAALVPVLVKHADPDGTHCYPSQETMALESGLTRNTVRGAIAFLVDGGLIVHVGNRARGLREYRLQMLNSIPTDQMSNSRPTGSDEQSDEQSDGRQLPTTSATSVPPRDITEEEKRDEVCSNCRVVGGHDLDCAHRPFVSSLDRAAAFAAAELDTEEMTA